MSSPVPQQPLVVRQSRTKLLGFVLLGGAMLLYYFLGPYQKTRIFYRHSPMLASIVGVVFFTLFFYFLSELIRRKAELILSAEGIKLRDKGLFEWHRMQCFKTVYYRHSENGDEELVLQFREFADLVLRIDALEIDREELVERILQYKGSADFYYAGHEVR
ncbi:MAG: hypothetical protein EOO15_18365 [Chitinophagaceae bacterium]|nr:MAG: hypothetical protein EOO15_18365 [Chitinophagaceae bacterium]